MSPRADRIVPLPPPLRGAPQGIFGGAVARGVAAIGAAHNRQVARHLGLVQGALYGLRMPPERRADRLEGRMAFAGVMVGMGQRQIGGNAEGVVVQRLVKDEVEKILQLDLAEGQNVRHAGLRRLRRNPGFGILSGQ